MLLITLSTRGLPSARARKQRCPQRPLPLTDLYVLALGLDELDDDFADALRLAERLGLQLGALVRHAIRILLVQTTAEVRHLLGALEEQANTRSFEHDSTGITTYYTHAAKCQVHIIRRLKQHTVTL